VTPRENCRARTVAPKFGSRHSRRATRVARSRGRHLESRGWLAKVRWVGLEQAAQGETDGMSPHFRLLDGGWEGVHLR
jgi:hypothetical protein